MSAPAEVDPLTAALVNAIVRRHVEHPGDCDCSPAELGLIAALRDALRFLSDVLPRIAELQGAIDG